MSWDTIGTAHLRKQVPGQPYTLGPLVYATDDHYALLRHVVDLCSPMRLGLEFGVGGGESARIIADRMPLIGFDSFQGLPEDWREDFPAGTFAQDRPPDIPGADIRVGMFADTLHDFSVNTRIGLIHIDCDLYSSTATVLDWLAWHMLQNPLRGTYVVFDEWRGYPGAINHEQRAWNEFIDENHVNWEVVGHGHQQWAIRVTS